jgi:hypothetical protein
MMKKMWRKRLGGMVQVQKEDLLAAIYFFYGYVFTLLRKVSEPISNLDQKQRQR